MVHRAQDSRLLSHLVKSEKEYSVALNALSGYSQVSLSALSAYAASCPPTQSHSIQTVVNAFTAAEEALRKYAGAVEGWREGLKRIKKCEEDVASVLRDREILIGRLLKVSSRNSNRNSSILSPSTNNNLQLPNDNQASQNGQQAVGGSSVSLTSVGGSTSTKVNQAQAELQACEAHLAKKEQELENVRLEVVNGGLIRRCKALVECGWIWGERGKEALGALEDKSESVGAGIGDSLSPSVPEKSLPHAYPQHHTDYDSQLSSLTPSQSASQIFLPRSSEESATTPSPSKLISQPSTSSKAPMLRRLSGSRSSHEHPRMPSFSLAIPPAHSIDDHKSSNLIIPEGRISNDAGQPINKPRESSDESYEGPVEVHENDPFANRTPTQAHPPSSKLKPPSSSTIRGGDSGTSKAAKRSSTLSVFGPGSQHELNKKRKPSSDLGTTQYATYGYGGQEGYARKRSTSFSLFGSIAGLFKPSGSGSGSTLSATGSAKRGYTEKTGTDGGGNSWVTRTDRNLARSKSGRASSSEEDLSSGVAKRNRMFEESKPSQPYYNQPQQHNPPRSRLSKRDHSSANRPPGSGLGLETHPRPVMQRSANSTQRSIDREKETAANTALNASSTPSPVISSPKLLNGNLGGSKSDAPRSARITHDTGSGFSGTSEVPRKDRLKQSIASPVSLPPAKLEVVRAPPSIMQAPMLVGPTPSPLVMGRGGPSAPKSAPSRSSHERSNSLTLAAPHRTESPNLNGVSSPKRTLTVPRTGTPPVNVPLKSALRKAPSPAPTPPPPASPALANNGSGPPSSSSSSADGTPRLGGSTQLKDLKVPIPRPPPPTTSSGIILPTPRRLSDIPASNRSSMYSDAGESIYETGIEDFGEDDESDKASTPPASPPPVPEKRSSTVEQILRNDAEAKNSTIHAPQDSISSTSTNTTVRRKSVRMIIHPTVTVTAPELSEPSSPEVDLSKYRKSADRPNSGGVPSSWETRINNQRNTWDDTSEEDEDYSKARKALQRVSATMDGLTHGHKRTR